MMESFSPVNSINAVQNVTDNLIPNKATKWPTWAIVLAVICLIVGVALLLTTRQNNEQKPKNQD